MEEADLGEDIYDMDFGDGQPEMLTYLKLSSSAAAIQIWPEFAAAPVDAADGTAIDGDEQNADIVNTGAAKADVVSGAQCCIEIRELPWYITDQQVTRRVESVIPVSQLHFIVDLQTGKSTGVVWVISNDTVTDQHLEALNERVEGEEFVIRGQRVAEDRYQHLCVEFGYQDAEADDVGSGQQRSGYQGQKNRDRYQGGRRRRHRSRSGSVGRRRRRSPSASRSRKRQRSRERQRETQDSGRSTKRGGRRTSPARFQPRRSSSPGHRRNKSPPRWGKSSPRGHKSPSRTSGSPPGRSRSPPQRANKFPQTKRNSPSRRDRSPSHRKRDRSPRSLLPERKRSSPSRDTSAAGKREKRERSKSKSPQVPRSKSPVRDQKNVRARTPPKKGKVVVTLKKGADSRPVVEYNRNARGGGGRGANRNGANNRGGGRGRGTAGRRNSNSGKQHRTKSND